MKGEETKSVLFLSILGQNSTTPASSDKARQLSAEGSLA
jgi:hypothetical protein